MSDYRKRFVQFNMLLIGIVLTVMVAAVAVYMGRDYYTGLRSTMEQVVAPLHAFSQLPAGKAEKPGKNRQAFPRRLGEEKNISVVFYTPETGEYSILSGSDNLSEEELPGLLSAVTAQEKDFGFLPGSRVIYYKNGSNPCKIALTGTGYLTHSMLKLCAALLGIWAGAMALFWAVSNQLSVIAARPMEEAIRREKQFVADASHDLKTPLSVILANNAILMENLDAPAGTLTRWLDSTQAAAKRMQQLIGEMLTLAEAERQDAPLLLEPVDLADIAMKAELELESLAFEKNVTLDTDLPEKCVIRGNADYLLRIVTSLLENALKYEPSGGQVTLTLTQSKRKIQLCVQNRGSQIQEEDLPHVFDRFYRGDKSRTNSEGSFGLGLAITKEMTQRLGGTIAVTSSEAEGTTFRVTFEH